MKSHFSRLVGQILFLIPLFVAVPFVLKLFLVVREELVPINPVISQFQADNFFAGFTPASSDKEDSLCAKSFEHASGKCKRAEKAVIAMQQRNFSPFVSVNINLIVYPPTDMPYDYIESIENTMHIYISEYSKKLENLFPISVSMQSIISRRIQTLAKGCDNRLPQSLTSVFTKEVTTSSSMLADRDLSLPIEIRLILTNSTCNTDFQSYSQNPDLPVVLIGPTDDLESLKTSLDSSLGSFFGISNRNDEFGLSLHLYLLQSFLLGSKNNLMSFHRIVTENPDLAVPMATCRDFSITQSKLTSCIARLNQFKIDDKETFSCSKESLSESNSVLFDPRATSTSTMPHEHNFALLAPFWLPLLAPVLLGTIRELRGYFGREDKEEAEEDLGYESGLGETILQ